MRTEEIPIGSKWRHFKGSIMVVYKHDNKLWVRPISSFLSAEDITTRSDNVTGQKYRFERIG